MHSSGRVLLIPYWLTFLVFFIMCSVSLFCCYEYFQYTRISRTLLNTSIDFNFQDDSRVLKNPLLTTPCTIGFFKSYILFPDIHFTDAQIKMLYLHELGHIKNKDSIFKFLCILCFCIHWYNPLSWFLLPLYNYSAEHMCDYNVIQQFHSASDRKAYACLLLDIASTNSSFPRLWQNNFSFSKHFFKRRILYIMNNNIKNKKSLSFLYLSVLFLFIFPVTTYAYAPIESTYNISTFDNLTEEITSLNSENFPTAYTDSFYELVDFSHSNEFTILDDKTIINSSLENNRATCKHTFKSGRTHRHYLHKDGSCVIECYSANICIKCNFKKDLVKISTITNVKCTH